MQLELHQVKGICCRSLPWEVERSWCETHTDFSLGPICSQVENCSRCPGSGRGWGGNPSRPANTWTESFDPSPQENGCWWGPRWQLQKSGGKAGMLHS